MKRIISVLIILALTLASILAVIPASAATAEPINTAEEFLAMKPDGNYYLAADIELSSSYDKDFSGSLDGNGKTITITESAISAFNKILNGSVSELTVKASFETAEAKTFGLLAREACGEFVDITVDADDSPTDAPEATDAPTDAPEKTDAPTDAPEEKKGCGGIIGAGAAAIVISLGLGATVLRKKD